MTSPKLLKKQAARAERETRKSAQPKVSGAYTTPSLEAYHKQLGYVPALVELVECDLLPQLEASAFGQEDVRSNDFYQPGEWVDAVISSTIPVGIRIRKTSATKIAGYRPAYDDTVQITPFEEGVARALCAYQHLANYTAQRGDVRMGFFKITHEQAIQRAQALQRFAFEHFNVEGSRFFSFID